MFQNLVIILALNKFRNYSHYKKKKKGKTSKLVELPFKQELY